MFNLRDGGKDAEIAYHTLSVMPQAKLSSFENSSVKCRYSHTPFISHFEAMMSFVKVVFHICDASPDKPRFLHF